MNLFVRLKSVKPLVMALIVGVVAPGLASAAGSQAVVQFTPHDRLYAVTFDGDYGEAVGEGGLIVESEDGGKTWKHEVTPPTTLAIFSVAISGTRSIAVGQLGLIMTRDDRKHWKKIDPAPTDRRLLRISVNKHGLAVAVGAFGTLLKSTDNGDTWTELKPDWAALYKTETTSDFATPRDEPTFYVAKVFDDGSIVIGGEYGQLNRSTDGGTTWTHVFQATTGLKQDANPPTIFGMQFRADGTGFAAGQEGLIVMTSDGGKTWSQMPSNSQASLFDIASTGDGHVFAVGMRSALVSEDSGKTWQHLNALDLNLNWYSGLSHSDKSAGDSIFAVGHSGRLVELAASGNSNNN